ncbi:AbrB/MazE/SpoVT family DNA-binding domain-containing protein [Sulfuriferula nivalis]|uniref:Antitoxin ChpS n=1 Tax=Sulfuriferula nivalis TaxID=2675298 RepID=A0A809RCC0_9PROT|nr:AbrB/MazE/SpoVT family DNA-binding domain-containing protein [Sulfuriferula nivalis]BBO99305.1 antitoxin ChpS [Sulfuriferula nivalis]
MKLFIRKLGNSAGIIFPATMLKSLNLSIGSVVNAEQIDGNIVLIPVTKTKYKLAELMAQCDLNAPEPADMQAWGSMQPVGKEFV